MSEPVTVDAAMFLAMGRELLAKQPFSVLIGAELMALEPGLCELALNVTTQLTQHMGFAHGGVVSYLADNSLTFAGGTALRVPVVTAEYKINYLRPAVGERLIARAKASYVGKTQAVCRCEVFIVKDGREKLCAIAQGTIAKLGEASAKDAASSSASSAAASASASAFQSSASSSASTSAPSNWTDSK